jgi:RNA polymerase sigma-70 factor (ECF subfamily)
MDLMDRARTGDRAAFDELVAPLVPELRERIFAHMGERLRQKLDIDDVIQETLLRAFQAVRNFRWQGERSLGHWLEGIAANFVLYSARTQRRRRELALTRDPEAKDVSPSRHQRREERFARLKKSIDELSPDHRTVLRLSRIEGLKVAAIAERMGRSESAVKNLLLRAMKELRESFGDTESMGLPDRALDGHEAGNARR